MCTFPLHIIIHQTSLNTIETVLKVVVLMCTFPLHIIIHQTSSYSKPLSAGLHWQKVSVKYLKIS